MINSIRVKGANENNLKNVDIEIPKNKIIVMTGLSGSGKSSLAFDTIYQEGQRRYVESLSAYARQFLGNMEKPDVESIEGLSPAISIDQKTTSKNPRSTVGTVTEIYDYLRLLYARVGRPICPTHNIEISSQSIEEMTNKVLSHDGGRVEILAPVINHKKGSHEKTIEFLVKEGYVRLRVNGNIEDIEDVKALEKNKRHSIDVVVDRVKVKDGIRSRIYDSLETACELGEGKVYVIVDGEEYLFSENYACPHCDFNVPNLEPRLFSFNAPYGACPDCHGLGYKSIMDETLVVPNEDISIIKGAIKGYENKDGYFYKMLEAACKINSIDMSKSFKDLTKEERSIVFYGSDEEFDFKFQSKNSSIRHNKKLKFEGVINSYSRRYSETSSRMMREWLQALMVEHTCPTCKGKRLNEVALSVKVGGLSIKEITDLSVKELLLFINEKLVLTDMEKAIAHMILKEIKERLSFLDNVGLSYLTLGRQAATLSGGEAQRIRLATQIGSQLTGVLYVLDEPSIGLHQRDNHKLINTLKRMRDLGNTLIVVEHDEDTMFECDQIIDIGPGAGIHGGQIVFQGTPEEILTSNDSITGKYLSGRLKIDVPKTRRPGNGNFIEVIGASANNLRNIDVKVPMGTFTVVSGVSGSGKSTLVNDIIYKGISNTIYRKRRKVGEHKRILGYEHFEKIVDIDQSPIGRTPRSNSGTYTGVFDDIRDLFTMTNEAKVRGYKKGRFSFNVKGGRCEKCRGEGLIKIEMHFLPDVYVPCEACNATRYNNETLEVKFKGKNIADVLDMTVDVALEFFEAIPKITRKLQTLQDVGLGYIKLGQSATTLSGGEAQRVKLASELHKRITNKTLYILDEPTTGLHTDDVKRLINVLQNIVDKGATVIVIEHNLDFIKVADYVIDLGPEGGDEGGEVIVCGTPEEVSKNKNSYTGEYLKKVLNK